MGGDRSIVLGVLVLAVAAAAAPIAQAGTLPRLESLRPISGRSTFTNCPITLPPPFQDRDFQPDDTAVEPRIAVDPHDPKRLAAAWMQDFASGIVVAFTKDGGATWRTVAPPTTSACTGGEGGAFDPGLSYGADGTLYLSLMRSVSVGLGRTTPDDEIAVLSSRDGGATWGPPVTVQPKRGTQDYNDYPTVAADPDVPGRVYVAWTWTTEPLGANTVASFLSVSKDGGRTFSAPRAFYTPSRVFFNYIGQLAITPGGRLAYAMELLDSQSDIPLLGPPTQNQIVGLTSRDGGTTWSKPAVITEIPREIDTKDPDTGENVEPGTFTLAGAADGTFWLVLRPSVTADGQQIVLIHSTGDGWSAPRAVVRRKSPGQMLLSSVAALSDRVVAVSFYDTQRDVPGDDRFDADVRMAVSTDRGETFEEIHLAGPFDLRKSYVDGRYLLPGTGVHGLGDYVGLAAGGNQFSAAVPLTAPVAQVGQSQLFVARVTAREPGRKHSPPRRRAARRHRKAARTRCRRHASRHRARRCRRHARRSALVGGGAVGVPRP